ncbi:hypothetical protein HRG_004747 [Hirsutella rhossiliensis]|uniref:Uncharacterized protein n=1 Tax=Hirsutella rhossiliensis TaxID=111463 RepID=A0A9P8N1R4_9HYPO|nr:uncharacterized protein HRG_04747 [Hirsutella rhossiliensis]KAH0964319.1 hypothetical protein HRG_04747 [Hirsutella rhossiliensis]
MTLADVAQPETAGTRRSASCLGDITPSSPLASGPFVHRQNRTRGQESLRSATLARPHFSSNLSDSGSAFDVDEFDGALPLGRDGTTRHTSNQIAALVDFFTNYPPPPNNFMSMPHGAGGCGRGRGAWFKFRKMSKRSKSLPRAPKQIRLPDSAVSGTTIGGHRHIAISIPLEVTPFAEVPKSQYPVCSPRDLSAGISTRDANKGAAALLRSGSRPVETPRSPRPDDHPLPPSQWIKPNALGHRPKGVPRGKPYDYIGILPAQLDTTVLNDSSAPWNSSPSSDEGFGHRGLSHSSPQQSPFPARSSSVVRLRGKGQHASIDSLLSQQQRQRRRQQQQKLQLQEQQERSQDTMRRLRDLGPPSPGGSTALSKASEASLNSSQWGKPRKSSAVPGLGSERPAPANRQDGRSSGLTVIADSPIVSHRDPSPPLPPPPTSPRNRREAVRDRKRRDMEAVRRPKQMKRDEATSDAAATNGTSRAQATKGTVQECAGDAREPVAQNDENNPTQHLSMSNMMVVVDFEPCPSMKRATRHRQSKAVPAPQSVEEGSDPSELLPQPSDPSIPTPPVSANGSPPTRHAAADRTSLTRRREWKAIREQERKAREAIALARAEAQGLAPGGAARDGKGSQADRELMCLYESYREHRLRDMERRLRRLERNGDVWLRALVPVLDNMNRTLAAAATKGELLYRDEHEDFASDGEADSAAERLGRKADRRRASRRRSLAHGRLLEKLARQREGASRGDDDDDDDDDYNSHRRGAWRDSASGSDDTSGLGSIEPLMRELAGEARRRQRAAVVAARAKGHSEGGAREVRGEAGRGKDG